MATKRIEKIELTPEYDEDGMRDVLLRVTYTDGTGGGDLLPPSALSGVLEILRRVSPIAMEALMSTWAP